MIALLAAPAFADVISKAPDAVAVTVYRDQPMTAERLRETGDGDTTGLAMISETRTVELPAGRTRIEFQGVADEIIPASATVEGLPGRQVERNFDYDLLSPASLIEKSVGQRVTLRRTNPRTGKAEEEPATLASGPDGVVVRTAHGVEALGCGAGPQALVFDHLPAGLAERPTLSAVADVPAAGRYKLTLNYLAVRMDWSADYVARLSPDGTTLDLSGWLTIANRSGASFANAPTQVVAGKLARVAPDLPDIAPRSVQTECWPMGTTSDFVRPPQGGPMEAPAPPPPMVMFGALKSEAVDEATVSAGKPRVVATTLGDYKLYSLAEPTTVAARQTKQIRFLHQSAVKFERLYVFDVGLDPANQADDGVHAATAILSFANKPENGLGAPLPAGKVSLRQPQGAADGRELFIGEPALRDVPVGEPFELAAGLASDVTAQVRVASIVPVGKGRLRASRIAIEVALTNAKPAPVTFEVRQPTSAAHFKVVAEQAPHFLKNGAAVWRVTIPANGTTTVTYAYEAG